MHFIYNVCFSIEITDFLSTAVLIFCFSGKHFQYFRRELCNNVEMEIISWRKEDKNKASGEMVDSPEANSTKEL